MESTILVAVVSAVGGIAVATIGPMVSAALKWIANGKVSAAQERMSWSRRVEVRLEKVEAENVALRRENAEHTRAITEIRAQLEAIEQETEAVARMRRLLEAYEQRVQALRRSTA